MKLFDRTSFSYVLLSYRLCNLCGEFFFWLVQNTIAENQFNQRRTIGSPL